MNRANSEKREQWIVTPQKLPEVRKRCPKCGKKTEFENSGKFRVNGNGRLLDVWLIYRCRACKSTWNMTIYERVSPESIDPEEYEGFLGNDPALAAAYGTSREVFARNMAEIAELPRTRGTQGKGTPDAGGISGTYTIKSVESVVPCKEEGVREIEVRIAGGLKLRADLLFAEQMGITRSRARKLFDQGRVLCDGCVVAAGSRVRNGQIFTIREPFDVHLEVSEECADKQNVSV